MLVLPEDTVLTQGMQNNDLWLVANGQFEVHVINHMRKKVRCNQVLQNGDYFGEISILYGCLTTASVSSVTYSVSAKIDKQVIEKLKNYAWDVYKQMREKSFEYKDEWTLFKLKILK